MDSIDLTQSVNKGRNVLNQIAKLMETESFRDFFAEHFNDWSNITSIIMCMKLYDITDQYYQKKGEPLESDQIIELVKNAFKNREIRQVLVQHMVNFTKGIENGFSQKYLDLAYIDKHNLLTL